jgi:chorismate mutase/prephenate dehydratase
MDALAKSREPVAHPRVTYQGAPGAFSETAAINFFGDDMDCQGLPQFEDVFRSLHDGQADYGVLPIENSTTGAIRQIYDLLTQYECYIVGETTVKVEHCLLANPGTTLDTITHV